MRFALTLLLPPLAGLAAFGVVWLAPYLAGSFDPPEGQSLGTLFAAWAIPVYPLALVLGLPVVAGAFSAPRWSAAITLAGMLGVYALTFFLIGVAWVGVGSLLGGVHQWLALGAGAVVHMVVFLGLRTGQAPALR
ncbi:hypothetical protein [Thiohalorhabdus sp.]|uniref:hypothetical protein n=1 Tax=Thiohalorhabdus sp. TaxID=3094134 RepID=UPI002FC34877